MPLLNRIPSQPQATTGLLSVTINHFVLESHANGIIQYVFSRAWLLSHNRTFLRFFHRVSGIRNLLIYFLVYCYVIFHAMESHNLCIHLPLNVLLNCFRYLAILNEDAMNILCMPFGVFSTYTSFKIRQKLIIMMESKSLRPLGKRGGLGMSWVMGMPVS